MEKLLFEIGTEEIPAQYMDFILKQYKELAEKKMQELRIAFTDVKTYGTPRRLAFIAEGLPEQQADTTVEAKGPSAKIAFDAEGKPSRAAQGFARGQGVPVESLETRDGYVYAVKHLKGQAVADLLPAMLDDILHSISAPKTMRWADFDFGFVRPIRWLVALFGSKVIPVHVNDVDSGNKTRGHRFLSNHEIEIPSADAYVETLEKNFIIVDCDKRREMIRTQVEELAKAEHGKASIQPDLLEEVLYLVEYPTALCGHIDEKYLSLPREAVITPMRDHQRYFPMVDENGKLMPKFITVRNGGKEHLDIVAHGNERVLRARLDDAVFFFDLDRKKSLAEHREALKTVAFQQGLGNMYDKSERLAKAAAALHAALGAQSDVEDLKKSTLLCKADLVTGMVTEFTELQGAMGKEYALLDGEKPAVATAIYEHYLPRFAGDELPKSENGRILAIVDKIDNIVATFSRGLAPTGSLDPYALRRQALGILNIILDGKLHIAMFKTIESAISLLGLEKNDKLVADVFDFIKVRFKNMLSEMGMRYDVVDAVLGLKALDDIYDIYLRIQALNVYVQTAEAPELVMAATRVSNISGKAQGELTVNPALFKAQEEKDLLAVLDQAAATANPLADGHNYEAYMKSLAPIVPVVNKFFDGVMVMDKDEAVKNNRLALIQKAQKLFNGVGNLALLVMDK